jgi:hypothetical protein
MILILFSSILAAGAVITTVSMAVNLFGSRSKSHPVLMLKKDILDDNAAEEDADLLLVAAAAAAARAASRVKKRLRAPMY